MVLTNWSFATMVLQNMVVSIVALFCFSHVWLELWDRATVLMTMFWSTLFTKLHFLSTITLRISAQFFGDFIYMTMIWKIIFSPTFLSHTTILLGSHMHNSRSFSVLNREENHLSLPFFMYPYTCKFSSKHTKTHK